MKKEKLTKSDLEQLVFELQEQLKTHDYMLMASEDRNNKQRIMIMEERFKKRPILDANLWLGLKIGLTLGSGITAILGILLLVLF